MEPVSVPVPIPRRKGMPYRRACSAPPGSSAASSASSSPSPLRGASSPGRRARKGIPTRRKTHPCIIEFEEAVKNDIPQERIDKVVGRLSYAICINTETLVTDLFQNAITVCYALRYRRIHIQILQHVLVDNPRLFEKYITVIGHGDSFADLPLILLRDIKSMFFMQITSLVRSIMNAALQPHIEDMVFFSFLMYCVPVSSDASLTEEEITWLQCILQRITSFETQILQGAAGRAKWPVSVDDNEFLSEATTHLHIAAEKLTSLIYSTLDVQEWTDRAAAIVNRCFRLH